MSDLDTLRRLARYSVALAVVISVPATLAFVAAFGWNVEASIFGDPVAILGGGSNAAVLLRWGAIGDMFYSYLLLAPLALFLHRRLRPNGPWLADLGALGAFAYIVIGGAAAATLAMVGSFLVEANATAPPAARAAIATSFDVLRNIVFFAIWQTLDALTAGTWILSTGWLLLSERRVVGRLLVVLGAGFLAMSVMTMLGIHSLAVLVAALLVVLVLWAGWVTLDRARAPLRAST